MTKKPSEKNKEWEKERRDRLNKAFEQLAKLLPQYDPTVTWSKNEIIQKSIAYIEEMHKKRETNLQDKDPAALREYNELLDTLKFFKSRNGQLAELLNKAKISIPPAKYPKFLAENPRFGEDGNGLAITTKPAGRPKKYANKINAKTASVLAKTKESRKKTGADSDEKISASTEVPTTALAAAAVPTKAIISTGVLLPLIPCQPATLVPIASPSNVPAPINSTSVTTYRKCKILSVQTLPRLRRPPKQRDGKIPILPRPILKLHVRRNDGKIAIPVLKRKFVAVKRKRRRKRKLCPAAAVEKKAVKRKPTVEKEAPRKSKIPKIVEKNGIAKSPEPLALAGTDLPDDYFATLQIPETNSNPSSVSPTAAFLLSFPVVSTTGGGRNTDGADETVVMLGDEQQRKGVTDGLENLNNFFSTKEYYKYCVQSGADVGGNGKEPIAAANDCTVRSDTKTECSMAEMGSTDSRAVCNVTSSTALTSTTWSTFPALSAESSTVSVPIPAPVFSNTPLPTNESGSGDTFARNNFAPKVSYAINSLQTTPSLPLQPCVFTSSALPVYTTPSTKTESIHDFQRAPFPLSQSSNFSVSNIFSTPNSPSVAAKVTSQQVHRIAASKSMPTALTTSVHFAKNTPFTSAQPENFTRSTVSTLPSLPASINSTANINAPSMVSSVPNPFAVPVQLTSTAFIPNSSAGNPPNTSTNSTKVTKNMQFTDYSSSFTSAATTCTHTRSYASVPTKSSARNTNQSVSRVAPLATSSSLSNNVPNVVRPLSFPISYNFEPSSDSRTQDSNSLRPNISTSSSELVSNAPLSSIALTAPLVTQSFINPLQSSTDPKLTASGFPTTNYYFPLQTAAPVTSTFTFNLTSTAPSTTTTSLSQPFLSYPSVKPNIPWIPATTADYKPSFTFSLTPSSASFTTTSSQTANIGGPIKSFATLPAVKPSETIAKTTFDPFNLGKALNPFPEPAPISNSFNSTNFTFSLAKPKNTLTVAHDSTKPLPSCTVDSKYQSSYQPYNFENCTPYPKETTNFTFALTKPTQSFSSSFSIDATLGVTSSYSSQAQQTMPQSSDFSKHRSGKSSHFANTLKTASKDPTTSYYSPDQSKLSKISQKSHVNWMTSSEAMQPTEIGQSYYPSHITPSLEFNNRRNEANTMTHGLAEDNFPAWSPSKILDTSHLMQSTTFPNYYTDLNPVPPYDNSKMYQKPYVVEKADKSYKPSAPTTNHGNFFSVSQLVDQTASNSKACEGYQKKNPNQRSKDCRKAASCNANSIHNMYTVPKPAILNNYSAEALISKKEKHRNYPSTLQPHHHHPHHNTDYYPPQHDPANNNMPQDSTDNLNYNSNYFYNYMPPTNQNFVQETDYLGAYSSEVQYGKFNNAPKSSSLSVTAKSEKRLPPPAPPPPNLMPYDSNYLPVPSIGAPPTVVVDAYEPHHYAHGNNFQHGGWNAKSSLPTYHHGQGIVPAGEEANLPNSSQGGTANLTNFNLSAICPEINDKVGQSNW